MFQKKYLALENKKNSRKILEIPKTLYLMYERVLRIYHNEKNNNMQPAQTHSINAYNINVCYIHASYISYCWFTKNLEHVYKPIRMF